MESKVSILVVIYDSNIEDCSTLTTLSELLIHKERYRVVISNNGPESIIVDLSEKMKSLGWENSFFYEEHLDNKPLGILYNDFIERFKSDKYVFLDHDSILTSDFIDFIDRGGYDVGVPRIISYDSQTTYYPFSDNAIFEKDGKLNSSNCYSIGSGIILTNKVAVLLKSNFGSVYDFNYALYGVDVSFFKRINLIVKSGRSIDVECGSYILHSLSRVENDDNPFRRKERALDYGITVRRYPSFRKYLGLIREIITKFFSLKWEVLIYMIAGYIYGKHPRVRRWLDK